MNDIDQSLLDFARFLANALTIAVRDKDVERIRKLLADLEACI